MIARRIPAVIVTIAGLAGVVALGLDTPRPADPVFSAPAGAWMPSVSDTAVLTTSWFCPGVPATGEDGVGGEVVVSNRSGDPLAGRFTVLTADGVVGEQTLSVEPWSQATVDVDAFAEAEFAGVVVELDGGGGFAEQRVFHPAGDSVAPCSDSTSTEWYLADGFTLDGSTETIILTNPFDESAVADLRFSTQSGETAPAAFRGFTIPPRSVETIAIAELGARDEPVIATSVTTLSGRLVVGRAQHYVGGGRLGYDVSLAAPALRDQFWFADGEQGEGISEQYSIYNPTDDDTTVDVVILGLPASAQFGNLEPIEVPAREVVVFDPANPGSSGESSGEDVAEGQNGEDDGSDDVVDDGSAGVGQGDEAGDFGVFPSGPSVPDGRHAAVFSTLAEPSIVVERVLTRPAGDAVATEVLLGAPPRADGYVASRWHVGIGPETATEDALVLYNLDQAEATVTVSAVGPEGPVPVPSLTDIPVRPGSVSTIDLVADAALGRELIVTATSRVFVERRLPRGEDRPGRSASWALPANL